jgi:hypothetical protein
VEAIGMAGHRFSSDYPNQVVRINYDRWHPKLNGGFGHGTGGGLRVMALNLFHPAEVSLI